MSIAELRALLTSHKAFDMGFLMGSMLDVLEAQQATIDRLQHEHVKQEERLTRMGKDIQRLQGVHGA